MTYVFLPPDLVTVHTQDTTRWNEPQRELERNVAELREREEERRTLTERLFRAQEEERTRIAEDIHDDPIQALTAVALRIASLSQQAEKGDQRQAFQKLEETIAHAIERLRTFLFELRPPLLEREGLAAAARQYLRRTADQTGARTELDDRIGDAAQIERRAVAYRIIQEALTNVAKHAKPKNLSVVLERRDGGLHVEVRDDGVGMSEKTLTEAEPGHLGVSTMRERAELSGGWLHIESEPGSGTTVRFWLPGSSTGSS